MSTPLDRRERDDLAALESDLPPFEKHVSRFSPTGAQVITFRFIGAERGGTAFVRHSAVEDKSKGGTTSHAQYAAIARLCQNHDLPLAELVVTFGNSGAHRWEHRPDLQMLHQRLRSGEMPPFVIFQQEDRLTRNLSVCESLIYLLHVTGLKLWFANTGRPVDPQSDKLYLSIQAAIADYARQQMLDRTREGTRAAWLAEKLTGPVPYAFCKDEHGYPALVPEEYEIVRWIYRTAAEGGEDGSLAAISQTLQREGHKFSPSRVSNILKADCYLTGVLTRKDKATGEIYYLRRVEIPDPIPSYVAGWARRNLYYRDGKSEGVLQRPTSRLAIEHGHCRSTRDKHGRPHILSPRVRPGRNSDGARVVMHPVTPEYDQCRALQIPDEQVERLVCIALVYAARCTPHHETLTAREQAELIELEQNLNAQLEDAAMRAGSGSDEARLLAASTTQALQKARNRIEAVKADPVLSASSHPLATRENLVWAAEQILLTKDPTPDLIALRSLLFDRGVGKVIIGTDDHQQIAWMTVTGKEGATDSESVPRRFFLNTCADILIEYLESHARDSVPHAADMFRTASQGTPNDAVRNRLRTKAQMAADHAREFSGDLIRTWYLMLDIPAYQVVLGIGDEHLSPASAAAWTHSLYDWGSFDDPA